MKHYLKTIMFLVSFAILTIVASESETRLNTKVETEPCMPLRCHNSTCTAAGEFDREESAANATRQEAQVPKICGTGLASRNIGMSNVLDTLHSEVQNYSKHQNNYTNDTESEIQNDCTNHREVQSQFVYFSGMLISVPFLIATYVVYWLLPELRNIHGQTLLPHLGCLIVTYGTLGATGVFVSIKEMHFFCIIIALIVTFTFAASFFWLNMMCFDIWWTIRKFRPVHGDMEQENRKKFITYSIYAWGGALVLTSVSAIMDLFPSVPKNWIRPEFCVRCVWFDTDLAEMLYFWGPMSITIIFNIGLFISTAQNIIHHNENTTHYLKSSRSRCHVKNNYRKQRVSVYLKLFVVMGMSWSLGIIELIIDSTVTCVPIYYCYFVSLINTLQGIVIFILFVFTKKTKNLFRKRLRRRFYPRRNSDLSSVSRITTSGIPLPDVNLRS